jgi:DNA-binding NtrC family response regulator
LTKNLIKPDPHHGRRSLHSLSPAEIFQCLKDNPGGFPHQARIKEKEVFEAFFHFFIEYFYMRENIELKNFIDSLERAILIKMLDRFNGNQRDTAEFLSLNHTTLNQKVRKHKISFSKKPVEG